MRFAYADPPYLGLAAAFYSKHHPDAADYDRIETHAALVERLCNEYDGWAMSLHTPALHRILPLCPDGHRIAAWVKPFASFKPGVNPAYAWEPVIFYGARKRQRDEPTVRDWHSENIALRKGLPGAKPHGFARWICDLLGVDFAAGDTIDDIFPGTGFITRAFATAEQREFALSMCDNP